MNPWTPPNPDYPPPKAGEPPLHRAARLGDEEAITRHAAEGADMNAAFDIGLDPGARPTKATPLMVAAGSGDGASVETLRLLLDLGADPKIVIDNRSAATFAASGLGWNYRPGGDAARLQALLDAGSPIAGDKKTANRMLCNAARAGDVQRLSVLTGLGLDVNGFWDQKEAKASWRSIPDATPRIGSWMFRLAFKAISEKVESEIFESSTSAPFSFEIPIHMAAESGSLDCVRHLVELGANVPARDNQRRTAIYRAGSKEAIRLLMDFGAPLEDADEFGWSPLTDAVGDGIAGIDRIRWLIELGSNVNANHDRGYTVFMCAVSTYGRDVEVCKLLVAAGADPYAVSELGYNAFHAAIDVNGQANAEGSVRSILTYLKEIGVDINHRNKSGDTPLGRADKVGTDIERAVLLELGAKR
ncbi:MAG: ankyrin repeat domain-containing protein [Fimbriimonadales bacterium]